MPTLVSGLSFLYPVGLWALAAVAIPILIHLFNRSRGRLVKIGHIDLIKNARKLKVTELKLADWLLLFLRVCLFALAALILAGLALPGLSNSNKATAYVSPAWLNQASPEVVSALLQQYSDSESSRILLLTEGFPEVDEQAVKRPASSDKVTNIWPLLAERLSLENHQQAIDVYAVDNLTQFGASKPTLPRPVTWHLIQGNVANPDSQTQVTAVIAYDSSRKADADMIRAALISLRANRLPGLSWSLIETGDLTDSQLNVDWLFLLSDHPAKPDIRNRIENTPIGPDTILTDAFGASRSTSDKQIRLPFYPFSDFRVSRIGIPTDYPYTLLNLTADQPLLQQAQMGSTRQIHFNSRFVPQWSSIARQPEFPELLLQLMMSEEQQAKSFAAATVQAMQLESGSGTKAIDTPLPRRSLQSLLAACMVLLWLLERWLSERNRRVQL